MVSNKNEIRLYYETHKEKAPSVAKLFNVSYRTLAYWIKKENWILGGALPKIDNEIIKNDIVQGEIMSAVKIAKNKLNNDKKNNLGDYVENINEVIVNNMLSNTTDDLLLQNISVGFIQKNIMLCALLAKDELLKYNNLRLGNEKPDPMFIACAEKVSKLFSDMQNTIYGKEVQKLTNTSIENNFENLSNDELLAIINS